MNSLRRDLTCSVVLLIVAVLYFVAASRMGTTALSDGVGPGGLPRICGAALALIAVLIGGGALLRSYLRAGAASASTASPAASGPTAPAASQTSAARRLMRAAGSVAIGIVYLAIVDLIGYPFAIAALIAAMALYQGESPSLRIVLIAAVGAAALWVLFEFILGVSVPAPWNG